MKRKRYSEEQIISILKERQAGASVPDLARRHAVVENTIYRWKARGTTTAPPTSCSSNWTFWPGSPRWCPGHG